MKKFQEPFQFSNPSSRREFQRVFVLKLQQLEVIDKGIKIRIHLLVQMDTDQFFLGQKTGRH